MCFRQSGCYERELNASKAEVKLYQGVYAAALQEWKIDAQRLSELDAERRQWLENREKSTFQNWIDRAEKAEAEVARLKEKVSERDQLVKTSNLLANEEGKTLQRWKDWGITKEQQLKRAVEIAEELLEEAYFDRKMRFGPELADLKGEIK